MSHPERYEKSQKIPGTSSRFLIGVSQTGWIGSDHILCITSEARFIENYKRVYFRDIQYLLVRDTVTYRVTRIILGSLTVLFFMFGWFSSTPGFNYVGYFVAALFAVVFLVDLVRGPTCRTYLKTAVQTEELMFLGRRARAKKFIETITPLLEKAQSGPAPESQSSGRSE